MKVAGLHATVLPVLLAGTSRQPLPGGLIGSSDSGSDGLLEIFSLMGQSLRFERPLGPGSFIVETEIQDERRIVGDRLRRPIIRLLTAKNAMEHPARALARAFDRLRLRPHPFDLPLLDAFVRSYADKLGTTAQHWIQSQKDESEAQSYFDPERMNDENWAQAALSRRVEYLDQRRRTDADAARSLVELTWMQEEADARFRLLQTFQTGLSGADQSFLAGLEKDRAPRVRALAARFLSRLGAGGENPALRAVLERIKRSQSGFIRKSTVLQLELPANVKDRAASNWILQAFADVSLSELAGAFQLTEEGLISAASADEPLLLALVFAATNERKLDLLELVVSHLPVAWERLLESGFDSLGTMPEEERKRWGEIIVHPYRKDLPTTYYLWDWLHRITGVAAADSVMAMVLKTKLLMKIPEDQRANVPLPDVIAAMCPASQRHEL
ncbi:MAG TPA: DUF5691 domain-containing protein, partial [Candidatus Angelobacter sp.]|nr:DUF5691 domain-containing protein [Candidatus Angelobacter sp.]